MAPALDPVRATAPHQFPPFQQPPPAEPARSPTDPKSNGLLAALPGPVLERWLARLEPVDMPQGAVLWESGRSLKYAYFPTTSIVAMLYTLADGGTSEVAVVGNEGIVGVALFMGGGSSLSRAVVLSAGRGFRLGATALMLEFEQGGPVTQRLLRYTQALITQLAQTTVCNRHHTLDQRLCRLLLTTLDRLGGTDVAMTQELISTMLGVRREGVTEASLNLQKVGLIRYCRGHIHVLDRLGLEKRSCECHAVVKREYDRLLVRNLESLE